MQLLKCMPKVIPVRAGLGELHVLAGRDDSRRGDSTARASSSLLSFHRFSERSSVPLNSLSKQDLFVQIQSPWDKGKATASDAGHK